MSIILLHYEENKMKVLHQWVEFLSSLTWEKVGCFQPKLVTADKAILKYGKDSDINQGKSVKNYYKDITNYCKVSFTIPRKQMCLL